MNKESIMRFCLTAAEHGVRIPKPALGLCGIGARDEAALHTLGGAGVLLKAQLSVTEMIRAVSGLYGVAEDMLNEIAGICGCCAASCGDCPQEELGYLLPEELLDAAEIRRHALVRAIPDPETNTVTFVQTNREDCVSMIPERILDALRERKICIGSLQEVLEAEQEEAMEE